MQEQNDVEPRHGIRGTTCLALLSMLMLGASGCATVGPASISNGRSTYNAVINRTEDEQILSMIVRQRYDETFGMLAVASVTASLRLSKSAGVNAGVGPRSGYAGNLVPLSAGVEYEENPTISYVPLRGEQFTERMLAPITAEQALLLGRMSTDQVEVLRLVVRRANGLANPLYSSRGATWAFDRFVDRFAQLREKGKLDIVRSGDGTFELLLHDHTEEEARDAVEMLRMVGVDGERGAPVTVPLRFFVGASRANGIDFETPSPLEVIEAAAAGVEVPDTHITEGLARPSVGGSSHELFVVHSSLTRPENASVAVLHRGWWFFVDGRDAQSKQVFMILRTLIGIRLDETVPGQRTPVLTVPVR